MRHPKKLQLSAYLDGELTLSQAELVADHLLYCTACQEEIKKLESFVKQISQLDWGNPSRQLSQQVYRRAQWGVEHRPRPNRLLPAIAASILVVAALGVGAWWRGSQPRLELNDEYLSAYMEEHRRFEGIWQREQEFELVRF